MSDDQNQEATIRREGSTLELAAKHLPDVPVAPAHGIAAIALDMAMKYHDMNMVKDGALYQQYKIEGRNMNNLHLDMVFETAMKIEVHLLMSEERIAKIVIDALEVAVEGDEPEAPIEQPPQPEA